MEQKLYDLASLQEVTGGNKEFMDSMIQLILTDTPIELKAIEIALENKDYAAVSSIAHKIKPSVNYFCINKLLDDVIAIETWKNEDEIMVKHTKVFIGDLYVALNQLDNV